MRGIIRGLEVVQVAAHASGIRRRQVVIAVYMALRALQRRVRAGQRKSRGRVIECCIAPRSGGVALLASLWEIRLHVIRICGALEVLQVATHASRVRAGQIVIAVYVTLRALQRRMRTGQRKSGGRMVEGRARPSGGAVALLARLREARGDVIRIRRALEILQVATDAGRIRAGQVVVIVHMALHALDTRVCAG